MSVITRDDNFEEWFKAAVKDAEIIDDSIVEGCNTFRAYGYKIWEMIQSHLGKELKLREYDNMYFPSFIPHSQLKKQQTHYDSFMRETVVSKNAGEKMFDDELIIRPTSEAIIYPSIKNWIATKEDLPLKLNQWCSVVRWEILKPPFPLIRNNEFLWHECHSCHATEQECDTATQDMFEVYKELLEDYMAIPVFTGRKPERRKFAGSDYTLALESMMGNGKSVQMATSHSLGQNFSKVFDLTFEDGQKKHVWQACSGLTTRTIGAMVMVHGDDHGVVMPPKVAPYEIAIINDKELMKELECTFRVVHGKTKDEWIKKGVPIIIDEHITRRDTLASLEKEKDIVPQLSLLLKEIQDHLLKKAHDSQTRRTLATEDYETMKKHISSMSGFTISPWCGDTECSRIIRRETLGSLRIVNPCEGNKKCIRCDKKAEYMAVFGQSY